MTGHQRDDFLWRFYRRSLRFIRARCRKRKLYPKPRWLIAQFRHRTTRRATGTHHPLDSASLGLDHAGAEKRIRHIGIEGLRRMFSSTLRSKNPHRFNSPAREWLDFIWCFRHILEMSGATINPVSWIGSNYKDFREFPDPVQDAMGYALYQAQIGMKHGSAKPLKGFGGAGVLELVADHVGDTSRAGVHGEVCDGCLRPARISEEVEVGNQDPDRRHGFDPAAAQGSRGRLQGAA